MDKRIDNICLALLPGKPSLAFEEVQLHNRIYDFRSDFWSAILFEILGDRRKLTGDDFMRQDVVAALLKDEEVIGLQMYTFFDLRLLAAREHTYITRYFDETFLERLASNGARQVMSIEYFSIHPDWRSANAGLSLGRVLLSLGLRLIQAYKLDAAIAAARDDVAASSMATSMGADCWAKAIPVFGRPTDLVVFFPDKLKKLENPQELKLADKLWQQRLDYLEIPRPKPTKLKITA